MATSGGSIAGTLLTYEKPKIPPYPKVNIELEQGQAIGGNIRNLSRMERLATLVNEFNIGELQKNLEKMFPGYAGLLAKGTNAIDQQLSGEIPDDVARQIERHAAEKSISGGYGGSEFAGNLEARDLGLTSLGITNQALGSAERWLSQAKAGTPKFDFSPMFITPQQRINVKLQENAAEFQRNMIKSQVDAMPEAWEAALATLFDNIEEMGSSALMMYAGAQMGGGGGGGMMGGMGGGGGGGAAPAAQGYQPTSYVSPRLYSEPAPSYSPPPTSYGDYQNQWQNPHFPSGGGP